MEQFQCTGKHKCRVKQNGAHQAHWARKVSVFDGKFHLSCMRFLIQDEFKPVPMVLTDTECL